MNEANFLVDSLFTTEIIYAESNDPMDAKKKILKG